MKGVNKSRNTNVPKGSYMVPESRINSNAVLVVYGLESGWMSPTIKILKSEYSPTGYPVSDNTVAWIASSMSIAAALGVSMYSYIADTYGRKIGVILIAIPEAISWIIKLSYVSNTTLIIARFISGLAAGGCFNIVPMYVKEISQDDIRGILGTLPILTQTTGVLIMYLLGAYLEYFTVIKIVVGLPIVIALAFVKAPESPAFLVKQGKIEEATEIIAYLRGLEKGDKIVQGIVEAMKKEDGKFKSLPNLTYAAILKEKPWRRGFIIIIGLFIGHALNGVIAVMTYASSVLASTGVKFDIGPEIQTISFPVVMIIGSISLAVVVEKCGRKTLLFTVFLISACAMAVIAILIIIQKQGGYVPVWLPVVTMMLAIAMYGAGVSPLPYIIMTEFFCFQIRAKAVGAIVTFSWSLTFILVTIYAPMVNSFGPHSPFIFYAIINLAGAIFTITVVPETKGKSDDEILKLLSKEKPKPDASV